MSGEQLPGPDGTSTPWFGAGAAGAALTTQLTAALMVWVSVILVLVLKLVSPLYVALIE